MISKIHLHNVLWILIILYISLSEAVANCILTGASFNGYSDQEIHSQLAVDKDSTCIRRAWIGSAATYNRLSFPVKPQHGKAGMASLYEYAYVPKRGYVGPDSFDMLFLITFNGLRIRWLAHVDVTIR